MRLSQAILAEGTSITLPPSNSVVLVMISFAAFAFVRGKRLLATGVFLVALLIAGAASLYNGVAEAPHDQQRPSSALTVQSEHQGQNARTPARPGATPGPAR